MSLNVYIKSIMNIIYFLTFSIIILIIFNVLINIIIFKTFFILFKLSNLLIIRRDHLIKYRLIKFQLIF